MLKFILGVIIGGIIGFLVCAVLSVNPSGNDEEQPLLVNQEIGNNDAESN